MTSCTIKCNSTYLANTTTQSFSSVVYLSTISKLVLSQNTVSYCFYGNTGSFIHAASVGEITDSTSTYKNNSAASGGVYSITSTTAALNVMTATSCTYEWNIAAAGGVIATTDGVTVTFKSCEFNDNNSTGNGGVISSIESSTNSVDSTLTI